MKYKYKMGNNLWIIGLGERKTDGSYNQGKVVGIELSYYGLGYISKAQFLNDHEHPRYKIAYIDCFTNKAVSSWYSEDQLSKDKPQ